MLSRSQLFVLAMLLAAAAGSDGIAQEQPEATSTTEAEGSVDEIYALPKIFLGKNASEGQFPFHAALGRKLGTAGNFEYHCGASLIAPRWLISARHCFDATVQAGSYVAYVGGTIYGQEADAVGVEDVLSLANDPNQNLRGDIVLIKLSVEAPSHAKPIDIQGESDFAASGHETLVAKYTILGMGATAPGSGPSYVLKFADNIPSVTTENCKSLPDKATGELIYGDKILADMICAGDINKPMTPDACRGDSGGGLIWHRGEENTPILAGIVSGGETPGEYGCTDDPLKAGLYTKAAFYRAQVLSCIALANGSECQFASIIVN